MPVPPHSTAVNTFTVYGSICDYWTTPDQEWILYYRLHVYCDYVGQGTKIAASVTVNNHVFSTEQIGIKDVNKIYTSPPFKSNKTADQLNFQTHKSISGGPDMGTCQCQLTKTATRSAFGTPINDWVNKMTCTKISPYLRVRSVMVREGGHPTYSGYITTPATVQTKKTLDWNDPPVAYPDWSF
ncbi:hypothetical protein PV08_00846 [Exophiala spinifera]|uniref:Uncharacterized protein n=1 Tax=Exophiala spinifera TaxID=91928 RepID=A0A0D1YYA7_9EURO|nr:uncharacterized protein PV08_00846 [Exophiala spinifera]KIW20271.1 hypothetical protein PV08_00846 [Exophiala spinifera]